MSTPTEGFLAPLTAFITVSARSNLDLIDYVEDFLIQRRSGVTHIANPQACKAGLYTYIGPDGAGVLLSAHSVYPFRLGPETGHFIKNFDPSTKAKPNQNRPRIGRFAKRN